MPIPRLDTCDEIIEWYFEQIDNEIKRGNYNTKFDYIEAIEKRELYKYHFRVNAGWQSDINGGIGE